MANKIFNDTSQAPISLQYTPEVTPSASGNSFQVASESQFKQSQAMFDATSKLITGVNNIIYDNKKMDIQQKIIDNGNAYQSYINENPELMNTPEGLEQIQKVRQQLEDETNETIQNGNLLEKDTNSLYYSSKANYESKFLDLQAKANMIQYTNAKNNNEITQSNLMKQGKNQFYNDTITNPESKVLSEKQLDVNKNVVKTGLNQIKFGVTPANVQNNIDSDSYNTLFHPTEISKQLMENDIQAKIDTKEQLIGKLEGSVKSVLVLDADGNLIKDKDGIPKLNGNFIGKTNQMLETTSVDSKDTKYLNTRKNLANIYSKNYARELGEWYENKRLGILQDSSLLDNNSAKIGQAIKDSKNSLRIQYSNQIGATKSEIASSLGIPLDSSLLDGAYDKTSDKSLDKGWYIINNDEAYQNSRLSVCNWIRFYEECTICVDKRCKIIIIVYLREIYCIL